VKQAVIREVKSLYMSCDQIGNLLLAKFSFTTGKEVTIFIPADIVFWLLKHVPANQDPSLQPPPAPPAIEQWDWDERITPRALSVQCKQFPDTLRMSFELERGPILTLVLNRSNVEMLRQMMVAYSSDLIDLDKD
jgi:hypothetical protein